MNIGREDRALDRVERFIAAGDYGLHALQARRLSLP